MYGGLCVIAVPAAVTVLLAVFTWSLARQYRSRRRPHQLAWMLALISGLVGSLAYVLCVAAGDNAGLFRVYYIGGALWIAPLLGLGSVYLLRRPLWARLYLVLTLVGGLLGTVAIASVPVDGAALAHLGIGPGTGVIGATAVVVPVAVLNSLGAVAVVAVALWSAWRGLKREAQAPFVTGNVLIGVGTLIVGLAGAMARLGSGAGFWPTMLVGWVILYGGFVVIGRPSAAATAKAAG